MSNGQVVLFSRNQDDEQCVALYIHSEYHLAELVAKMINHAKPRWGDYGYDTRMAIALVLSQSAWGVLGELGTGIFTSSVQNVVNHWILSSGWTPQIVWDERKIVVHPEKMGGNPIEYTFENWINQFGENYDDYFVWHKYDSECGCVRCDEILRHDMLSSD